MRLCVCVGGVVFDELNGLTKSNQRRLDGPLTFSHSGGSRVHTSSLKTLKLSNSFASFDSFRLGHLIFVLISLVLQVTQNSIVATCTSEHPLLRHCFNTSMS